MSVAEVLCSTRQSTTHSFFSFNSRECDYHTEERSQMQLDRSLCSEGSGRGSVDVTLRCCFLLQRLVHNGNFSVQSGLSFCLAVSLQHSIQVISVHEDLAQIQHSSPPIVESRTG